MWKSNRIKIVYGYKNKSMAKIFDVSILYAEDKVLSIELVVVMNILILLALVDGKYEPPYPLYNVGTWHWQLDIKWF